MVRTKNLNVNMDDTAEHEEVVGRLESVGTSRKRRKIEHGASSSRPLPGDNSSSEEIGGDDANEIPDYQNISLLRSYFDHVASKIWQGKERGILNRCNNRAWPEHMPDIENLSEPVQQHVLNSGLATLIGSAYQRVDKRLLTAFSERWYEETCTFHLPCGEMTVTLDDVSCILHVPVTGILIPYTTLDKADAINLLVELLGMEREDAQKEVVSGSISFLYLEKWFHCCIREKRWDEAARTYLLHLVGSTLFMNKSLNMTHVHYLEALRHLELVNTHAWGASGLAWLYQQLSEASKFTTVTLAGNMSLLQAWIFEHFPDIGCGTLNERYAEHMPRIFKWIGHQSRKDTEHQFRQYIEMLRSNQVIWQPYDPHHRQYRQFENISLYSGYIRNGRYKRPYLPERVVRQFGYVQGIPRSPFDFLPDPDAIDVVWATWHDYVLDDEAKGPMVTRPGDCSSTYMSWLHRFSHPYLLHTTGANAREDNAQDRVWQSRMDIISNLARSVRDMQIAESLNAIDDIITIAEAGYDDQFVLRTRQHDHMGNGSARGSRRVGRRGSTSRRGG